MSKKPENNNTIALNRKARHDFQIEETYEAGVVLQGWEVKSLRAGKGQISESYVLIKRGELWLLGAHINPLDTASTHVKTDPTRTRKLLVTHRELNKLIGAVQRQGYTIIPLALHWKRNHIKLEIALAKGKKKFDKREVLKKRDTDRELRRHLKS